MMLDIVEFVNPNTGDLGMAITEVSKAGNVVSTQLQSLEYAPNFGVDLKYFLTSEFRFPNASFKSYLIQRLTESQITVTSVIEVVENLFRELSFTVGDSDSDIGGFIA